MQALFHVLIHISIHAPAKGATHFADTEKSGFPFQSTLPQRERHSLRTFQHHGEAFQSTLPQRERLFNRSFNAETEEISIHAPAKGATFAAKFTFHSHIYFNPRSRKGSDELQDEVINFQEISIHAPAKGATER